MVEKLRNEEEEELFVTTSSELNSNDFQILTPTDKNFVVIKSKLKVAIFCTKTTRLVSTVFKDQCVWCIWIQKNRVRHFCLLFLYFNTRKDIFNCVQFGQIVF